MLETCEELSVKVIFEFSEESDGTRRLFDLLDILISNEKNKIYVIDELERSLHPKLTCKFLELFFEHLKENNTQLIFTTHESTIMDQELLRRDEIWFFAVPSLSFPKPSPNKVTPSAMSSMDQEKKFQRTLLATIR